MMRNGEMTSEDDIQATTEGRWNWSPDLIRVWVGRL